MDPLHPDDCSSYSTLVENHRLLKKDYEVLKQSLYDSSRQLRVNEALLREYQGEIETLQREEASRNQKYEAKISNLEEILSKLRSNHSQSISDLELELLEKAKETDDLKTEIESLRKKPSIQEESNLSYKLNEMVELTNENELLKQNYDALEQAFENLQIQNFALEESLQKYKNEVSEFKESLEAKREELLERSALIDKLHDELFMVNKELEMYKNKPLQTDSKGNSLFAEVDDRRVYLQKNLNDMKSIYVTLRQQHSKHEKVISHLRKENADLLASWKKDLEEVQEDHDGIVDSLNSRLKVLEEINDRQKRRLEEQKPFDDDLCPEYQFYQDIIDSKSSEIKTLEKKLADWAISNHMLSVSLAQANKELRGTRLSLLELRQKIEDHKEKELMVKEAELCIGCTTGIEEMADKKIKEHEEASVCPLTGCLRSIENTQKERLGTESTHQTSHKIIEDSLTKENLVNVKREGVIENEGCSKYPNILSDETKDFNNSPICIKKKGVKFDKEILSPPPNPMRRRGTKIFVMKKNNISDNSNVKGQP